MHIQYQGKEMRILKLILLILSVLSILLTAYLFCFSVRDYEHFSVINFSAILSFGFSDTFLLVSILEHIKKLGKKRY